ncbi:13047_t:CDS:2 [Rhizophagus irregularis]|nr:13047_t:CDS:2 [Rhizophagus irregularis]
MVHVRENPRQRIQLSTNKDKKNPNKKQEKVIGRDIINEKLITKIHQKNEESIFENSSIVFFFSQFKRILDRR